MAGRRRLLAFILFAFALKCKKNFKIKALFFAPSFSWRFFKNDV